MAGTYRIADHVINEVIEGEAILIDLTTGTYYSLDDTGALIWEALRRGDGVNGIVATVAGRYRGESAAMLRSVTALIQELMAEGLVQLAPGSDGADAGTLTELDPAGVDAPAFSAPRLHKYTDMQDLILLDPVHEVQADKGWPHRPAAEHGA